MVERVRDVSDENDRASAPRFLPRHVRQAWNRLARLRATGKVFDPAMDGLPAPVLRWMRHTIRPGAPLRQAARLVMHGQIKIGRWRPFTARQILTPDGFVWAATAGRFPLPIRGFDRLTNGRGEMRWKLLGLVPVATAAGADVTRSAAGRLAGELLLLPASALADTISWQPGDGHQATATITRGELNSTVAVEVDDVGALRALTLPRWGNPDGGPYREHVFGVAFDGERDHGDYTLPTSMRAGWWFGTNRWAEGEFFRATIDHVEFF